MRSQNGNQFAPIQLVETTDESPKKPRIKYTRELLLSLSELEICSKLPSGFDASLLSEFEDASNSIPERSRLPGSLSAQNFRRGEYGSSPPTRGDSGSSSRGIYGRWDSRSSGSNDKDTDSQLDSESESSRRYGNQPRRPWQNSEQDGLLGSGSFPKASGFTSAAVSKIRGNGQFPLSKTNEPYQPPRPYKAPPHSRRDATDIINEETFGSSESSSQDRVEEERKRRASFEQFRKEQKTFQEKPKEFPDKHKENVDPDIAALLANSEVDKKLWDKSIRFEDMAPTVSQGDSVKSSIVTQTSAPRPLVPPGFKGVALEKNLATKSSNSHLTLEVGNGAANENIAQTEDNGEKSVMVSSDGAIYGNSVGVVSSSFPKSIPSEDYGGESSEEGKLSYTEKVPGHDIMGIASKEHSTSILAKLFGKASIVDSGVPSFSEPGDVNADIGGSVPFQSSKFTHWFLEEEKRPEDDLPSGKSEDLLSLIVNGEKDGSLVPRASEKTSSIFPLGSNDIHESVTTTPCTTSTTEPPYQPSNSGGSQGVLTCEDLEQSILSEFSENSSSQDHSLQAWSVTKDEKKPGVDNQASQHLLSLLQKGPSVKDIAQPPIYEPAENLLVYEAGFVNGVQNASVGDVGKVTKSENNLTLETLFGTAFMKELQSVKAPVSVQRGSVGGATQTDVLDSRGFPFPAPDDGFLPFISNKTTLEGDTHVANHMQQNKYNKNEEAWLGFDASQSKVGSNLSAVSATDRPEEALEIQLPDEESLITLSDPVGKANKADRLTSSSMPVDIVDKLAALNAVLKKERSTIPGFDDPPFLRGPSNPVEPDLPYQNQHERPTSQFAHLQMNHGRHMFQPSDSHTSHMNPPSKIMGSENIVHPEFSQHHFPANVMHPSSSFQHAPNGPTRFSPPAHHPMLQQMHMQGNLLPPHLLRGVPRGASMPPYAINRMSGYAPESNPMQNHPFGHQQPNYGGHELPMQAHAVGSGGNNHPEALEKLFEMELRANLKQLHPVAGAGHNLGTHGHGIDMSFRYR